MLLLHFELRFVLCVCFCFFCACNF